MDHLAEMGTTFERAVTQVPLCNPARTSVLSGLQPSKTGILDNLTPWYERVDPGRYPAGRAEGGRRLRRDVRQALPHRGADRPGAAGADVRRVHSGRQHRRDVHAGHPGRVAARPALRHRPLPQGLRPRGRAYRRRRGGIPARARGRPRRAVLPRRRHHQAAPQLVGALGLLRPLRPRGDPGRAPQEPAGRLDHSRQRRVFRRAADERALARPPADRRELRPLGRLHPRLSRLGQLCRREGRRGARRARGRPGARRRHGDPALERPRLPPRRQGPTGGSSPTGRRRRRCRSSTSTPTRRAGRRRSRSSASPTSSRPCSLRWASPCRPGSASPATACCRSCGTSTSAGTIPGPAAASP